MKKESKLDSWSFGSTRQMRIGRRLDRPSTKFPPGHFLDKMKEAAKNIKPGHQTIKHEELKRIVK